VSNPFRLLTFLLTLAIVLSALQASQFDKFKLYQVRPILDQQFSLSFHQWPRSTYPLTSERAGSTCPNLHALLRASTTIMKVNL